MMMTMVTMGRAHCSGADYRRKWGCRQGAEVRPDSPASGRLVPGGIVPMLWRSVLGSRRLWWRGRWLRSGPFRRGSSARNAIRRRRQRLPGGARNRPSRRGKATGRLRQRMPPMGADFDRLESSWRSPKSPQVVSCGFAARIGSTQKEASFGSFKGNPPGVVFNIGVVTNADDENARAGMTKGVGALNGVQRAGVSSKPPG